MRQRLKKGAVSEWKRVVLAMAVMVGILFFGLRPRDFDFSNRVEWLKDQNGIRFGKYGIAYTDPLGESVEKDIREGGGFSVEIALKAVDDHEEGFHFILAFHNGRDREQLLMGQWRSWLILMNGDDYAHKRGSKRISVNTFPMPPTGRLLTITTGNQGTRVYFDGRPVRTRKNLILKIPEGGKIRLLVGNSVYGRHSWSGEMYGLAIYPRTLTAQTVALHYDKWSVEQGFSFAKKDKPLMHYSFDEKGGPMACDQAGKNHHLQIPPGMQILQREILRMAWNGYRINRRFIYDVIINVVGFIPFGLVLTATLIRFGGNFKKHHVLISLGVCFLVSLTIEIAQAWMPSRSSQMPDLLLNTLGAFVGITICRFFSVRGFKNG